MEENKTKENLYKYVNNVNLYKKYKMFAYDWLFYYAISILYLTTAKKFTVSEVMYLSSILYLASCFFQLTGSYIVEKIKYKESIIVGNLIQIMVCVSYIIMNDFNSFVIANILMALGNSLKNLSEGNLLYGSLKKIDEQFKYSKIEGSANSKYYYLDAISGIIAGFLFQVNPILPLIFSLITLIVATGISFKFNDYISTIPNPDEIKKQISITDFIHGFRQVIMSKRAKAIFIYSFMFSGIIQCSLTLYKVILIDFGMEAKYIALIASLHSITIGIGMKLIYYFEKKTKNKTLSIISISYILFMYLIGFIATMTILPVKKYSLICIFVSLASMAIAQGAYKVIIKKYVVSFTTSKVRTNITALYYMFEGIGQSLLLFVCGKMAANNTNSATLMIIGTISFAIMILVLTYMKTRIGLKPEEYGTDDLYGEKDI